MTAKQLEACRDYGNVLSEGGRYMWGLSFTTFVDDRGAGNRAPNSRHAGVGWRRRAKQVVTRGGFFVPAVAKLTPGSLPWEAPPPAVEAFIRAEPAALADICQARQSSCNAVLYILEDSSDRRQDEHGECLAG